jgi:hypothetical protein
MAWVIGKHAEAPQGVLCFAGPEPGTVTWYEPEEGDAPPPPPPPPEGQQGV